MLGLVSFMKTAFQAGLNFPDLVVFGVSLGYMSQSVLWCIPHEKFSSWRFLSIDLPFLTCFVHSQHVILSKQLQTPAGSGSSVPVQANHNVCV